MKHYKGISKHEYPNSPIWSYIALYSSITDDFDDDIPLQKLVQRHHLKTKIYITLFNLTPYLTIGILYATYT
ncbi:MAG: hypothetical protein GQ570_11705 [Helicobacteraceae bacterium]|nr:hypothetical protein [Helicobacteraceae bacterium]